MSKLIKKVIKKPIEPKSQTYTLYLPVKLIETVREMALHNEVPINYIVISALKSFIRAKS